LSKLPRQPKKESCRKESGLGKQTLFDSNRDLFDRLCSEANLLDAFIAVKRNKGAAGVDGVTIQAFEAQLQDELAKLANDLRSWQYKPKPVKRVEIPKEDGSMRKLGIPCVRDRVMQACLKTILEEIFEPNFSNSSYGFRPGRRQKDAVQEAQRLVQEGREWVVDIDLAQFFDTMSQDRLIHRLSLQVTDKRILRLVGMILRSGVAIDGEFQSTTEGSTQGSPISPLLSNVVLDELDKELEARGLRFVRWADDANIFVKSEEAAKRVLTSVTKFIERKLKLKVNQAKSKAAKSSGVKFLGFTIKNGEVVIAKKSMRKAMAKVSELVRTSSPVPVQKTMERVNLWYQGWAHYFALTQYPMQLQIIEAHVRRRFRARIVRQLKKRKYLCRRLESRGVKRKTAQAQAYSAKGPWKLSSGAMNYAYTVDWFIETIGQEVFSNRSLSHWHPVKKRIIV
jgi:RNA-directed DNA polymerase